MQTVADHARAIRTHLTSRGARALQDRELLREMRAGEFAAWAEFEARFRPLLEHVAGRMRIPSADWAECVGEVIEDEAIKLSTQDAVAPASVVAWLVAAMRRRYLTLQRTAGRRDRRYAAAAAAAPGGERVVATACSASMLKVSEPVLDEPEAMPLARLGRLVAAELSESDRLLLMWCAEGVPRRLIAEWTGTSYESTRKRIQRLCAKVRGVARQHAARFSLAERRVLERALGAEQVDTRTRPALHPCGDGS